MQKPANQLVVGDVVMSGETITFVQTVYVNRQKKRQVKLTSKKGTERTAIWGYHSTIFLAK